MAGVLDTFLYLFEADAEGLNDGIKKADKGAKHLEKQIKDVDSISMNLGKGFAQMAASAVGAMAAAVSLGALVSGVFQAADAADALNDLSGATGESVENLDAWGAAVKSSGGTAEGFQGSLKSLNASLTQVDVTGRSKLLPFFEELGIKADGSKTAMEMLPELADAFEKVGKTKALGIGQKMGLDQGTIMLLQQGRRSVEELIARQKELSTITQEDAEVAGSFNDAIDDTQRAFRGIFTSVGTTILPILTRVMVVFQDIAIWARKHSTFVTGFMIALAAAIVGIAAPAVWSLATAVFAATWPFLLIGAAIAAVITIFALLYDEIMNFMEGNDSMIGRLLEQYPALGKAIKLIGDYFKMMWDVASWVWNSLVSIFNIVTGVVGILFDRWSSGVESFISGSTLIQGGLQALMQIFDVFKNVVGEIWDWITEKVGGLIETLGKVGGLISSVLGNTEAEVNIAAGKQKMGEASSFGLASSTSSSISNSANQKSTNVQVGKVEVQTQATDSAGISKSIGNALGTQLRHAANNFDDGVAG